MQHGVRQEIVQLYVVVLPGRCASAAREHNAIWPHKLLPFIMELLAFSQPTAQIEACGQQRICVRLEPWHHEEQLCFLPADFQLQKLLLFAMQLPAGAQSDLATAVQLDKGDCMISSSSM